LTGCGASQFLAKLEAGGTFDSPDAAATVRGADLSARYPANIDERSGKSDSLKPLLFPGAQPDAPAASPDSRSGLRTASLQPVSISGDGVEMNFEGADIQTVAKTLLGDVLRQNSVGDPRGQCPVALAPVGPIPRKAVLPTFESALRMQNAAIVHDGRFLKIVPMPEAAGHASIGTGAGEPGYGVSGVSPRSVSAATTRKTTASLLGKLATAHFDKVPALGLIHGTTSYSA